MDEKKSKTYKATVIFKMDTGPDIESIVYGYDFSNNVSPTHRPVDFIMDSISGNLCFETTDGFKEAHLYEVREGYFVNADKIVSIQVKNVEEVNE